MNTYPIESLEVAAVYQAIPQTARRKLLAIRQMIFEISEQTDRVGRIDETLKWGVPSYLTKHPKSGTTVRLQWIPASERYGIFVHCQTSLIPKFKQEYPSNLTYDKSRGILFDEHEDFPSAIMKKFLTRALTYHSMETPVP